MEIARLVTEMRLLGNNLQIGIIDFMSWCQASDIEPYAIYMEWDHYIDQWLTDIQLKLTTEEIVNEWKEESHH